MKTRSTLISLALVALAGTTLAACGDPRPRPRRTARPSLRGDRDARRHGGADNTVPPIDDDPVPAGETLPPAKEPKNSPAPFRVVSGTYDLTAIVASVDPLIIETRLLDEPTSPVVATNGAGDASDRVPGQPLVPSGTKVKLTYQMFSWQTNEYYDGTPSGTTVEVIVDDNDLPAAVNRALHWATTDARLLVGVPAGDPEIPYFVPADTAYYFVIDVFAVTPA
ncbi:MAG: hypothetical protein R2715_23150 [Ilumatobacteraceae bacterium]